MALPSVERRFITDAWRDAVCTFPVRNPSSGAVIAQVADCGPGEAAEAARIAWEAFESWRATTAFQRSELLMR